MEHFILSFDLGTTSCRAILYDKAGLPVHTVQQEFNQYLPKNGWVEHDALEIFDTQISVVNKLFAETQISANQIKGVGITNQRETTVLWSKSTGEPIGRAIVWQDNRTAEFCELLVERGLKDYVQENTGLVIAPYFSATKINWLIDNIPSAKDLLAKNDLLFGTIDSWIIWKLTLGKNHITDYSNASRTMLFNIKKLEWDSYLLNQLEIPSQILPQVVGNSGVVAHIDKSFFGEAIPISGIAGDQQAALFGQLCFEKGMAKNTYGTGCFMLLNTGKDYVKSNSGLLTTIAWGLNGEITYALEGSVFIAGAAVQWLRDGIKLIDHAFDSEYFASKVPDAEGVIMVPAFNGLGAPYWDTNAKGAIFGLGLNTNKSHIIRATLDSLAFQTRDVLDAMQKDSGLALKTLKVDGGASVNYLLMQFQADILGVTVERPKNVESTSAGAAYLAGLGVGFYRLNQLQDTRELDKTFRPKMVKKQREKLYKNWLLAVSKCRGWNAE
jgi:glycerol kinase